MKNRRERVLVYGAPGVGKTCFAASAPSPVLILDTQQGTTYLDQIVDPNRFRVVPITNPKRLDELLVRATGEFPYQTVVIDKIEDIRRAYARSLAGNRLSVTRQEWGETAEWLARWLLAARHLPAHVIYVAGEREIEVKESLVVRPDIGGISLARLEDEVDHIFRMSIETDMQGNRGRWLRTVAPWGEFCAKTRCPTLEAEYLNPTWEMIFGSPGKGGEEGTSQL